MDFNDAKHVQGVGPVTLWLKNWLVGSVSKEWMTLWLTREHVASLSQFYPSRNLKISELSHTLKQKNSATCSSSCPGLYSVLLHCQALSGGWNPRLSHHPSWQLSSSWFLPMFPFYLLNWSPHISSYPKKENMGYLEMFIFLRFGLLIIIHRKCIYITSIVSRTWNLGEKHVSNDFQKFFLKVGFYIKN